ncbi:branched-chain amino acid ABC transporter permease [Nonomuraea sp. NN258]|uniref:ABC transporter permease subunit n=1 Tax=Nonomuraea antri TaxID=2730852 RepID=UPI0015694DD5|nr:branched-chain amino acid ABC transporter permease [Nonomuraea antri]NRQ31146.1 branched-chain amino acid ABC transporter permease [Nonomuraea antri]
MLQGLVSGLAAGGTFAALGLLLTALYRLTATVNLAVAATGVAGVYAMAELAGAGRPYWVAALAGVLASAAVSAGCGYVMTRWFADSGPQTRTAVSIAQLIGIIALAYIWFGDEPRVLPNPAPGRLFTLAGVVVTQGALVLLLLAVAIGAGTYLLLGRTPLGLRLRAMAERPVTTELLGIGTRLLTVTVWAIAGALSALVLLLVAPVRSSDILSLSMLIVPACAAALLGGLRRLDGALLGGLALGLLEGLLAGSAAVQQYRDVVPFAAILLILMWSRRREVWDASR